MDKNIIQDIFNDLLSNIQVKCRTLESIRKTLNTMSQSDKEYELYDKLNQGEREQYFKYVKSVESFKKQIESFAETYGNDYLKSKRYDEHKRILQKYEDTIFRYERRIIEGYVPHNNPIPDVDRDKFKPDEQYSIEDVTGSLEQSMINKQNNIDFKDNELAGLMEWWGSGHWLINSSIYNGNMWNNLSDAEKKVKGSELNKYKQGITSAINKSEGLPRDTMLFRGDKHFDISLVPGDHINFKGYTSMSFSKVSAKRFMGDDGYMINFLAPKNTKGVCGNSDKVKGSNKFEHEFLTGRGTEGTIIDIDYDNHEVYVLVD